ncbi:hypothetical protein JCM18237_27130 [Halorubrum luteum]
MREDARGKALKHIRLHLICDVRSIIVNECCETQLDDLYTIVSGWVDVIRDTIMDKKGGSMNEYEETANGHEVIGC